MARVTPRLGLYVWDLTTDPFDHVELADNWDAIDAQAFIAKGFEIVSSLPTTGNFPGRVVMLSSPSGGFAAWTLCRFDGGAWAPIGAIEIHPSLPSNPTEGRMVILSAANSGFAAWTLLRYSGAAWRPIGDIAVYENSEPKVGSTSALNFQSGAGITYTIADDNTNEKVDVTVNAEVSAIAVKKNGVLIGNRQTLNFVEGSNVTLDITSTGSPNEINITANVGSPPTQPGTSILDYAVRNEVASDDVTLGQSSPGSSTWTELDTTNLRVDFTVPASGQVMLSMSANVYSFSTTAAQRVRWAVTTGGGSQVNASIIGLTSDRLDGDHIVARRLITGLTPSSNLTWYWAVQWGQIKVGKLWSPATLQVIRVD